MSMLIHIPNNSALDNMAVFSKYFQPSLSRQNRRYFFILSENINRNEYNWHMKKELVFQFNFLALF